LFAAVAAAGFECISAHLVHRKTQADGDVGCISQTIKLTVALRNKRKSKQRPQFGPHRLRVVGGWWGGGTHRTHPAQPSLVASSFWLKPLLFDLPLSICFICSDGTSSDFTPGGCYHTEINFAMFGFDLFRPFFSV